MDVQLYVYDLSQGLARNVSAALLGIQIDAIYHTAIVMSGIEYTYDGGVKSLEPGSMGAPMEIIKLGRTDLPMDIIIEYLDSLREIYTAEAYDIFTHNCKGIPSHIVNLPDTVLNTPFGKMMRPQIEMMVKDRQSKKGGLIGLEARKAAQSNQLVKKIATRQEMDSVLAAAEDSCAVIFFTSPTCRPCKALYPVYDELAAEVENKAYLTIVDISTAFDVAAKYEIKATPTFVTFLHGQEDGRWSGGDARTLRGNVKALVQSAWPPHLHESLRLPTLRSADARPLASKLGSLAEEAAPQGLIKFLSAREHDGAAEATLPDLAQFSKYILTATSKHPPEIMFMIVDLLRAAMSDLRVSGYYAEEKDHITIAQLISYVNSLKNCPYALRLVALQLSCNLFSSPLYPQHILCCRMLTEPIVQLITTSLLDDTHHNVRVAAASLSFNIATANSSSRSKQRREALPEGDQVEIAASLLEAIEVEAESSEALKGYLLAFGNFVFCAPKNGELVDLLKTMDAQSTVLNKKKLFSQGVTSSRD
ncbi:PUL domain-containing protein [Bisporella sp. PMI_857]|nr:PUL domain-containing protein [Bisporella sp. PMI_857]KAH8600341.1 PUL domain-containing protein [Bisporella sp. PMI_857]